MQVHYQETIDRVSNCSGIFLNKTQALLFPSWPGIFHHHLNSYQEFRHMLHRTVWKTFNWRLSALPKGSVWLFHTNWKAAQVFGLDCLKLHASFHWHPTWIPGFTRMPWYLWLVLYIISGTRDLGFYVSSEGLVILTRYWNPLTQNYYHTDDLHSFKTWEEGFCCHQQMCIIS